MVKDVFESSHGTYGYRRVAAALARQKLTVDPSTVRSVTRELSLVAAQPRAKVRTTVPAQDLDERPDLVRRDPAAPDPGLKWVGDIACTRTWAGLVLPGDRAQLLHQEGRRVRDGRSHAHLCGVRRDRHGGAELPAECRTDDIPLRQGKPVRLPEFPRSPQGVRDTSFCGAHGGVLGRYVPSRSTPRRRTSGRIRWSIPHETRRSMILRRGSS